MDINKWTYTERKYFSYATINLTNKTLLFFNLYIESDVFIAYFKFYRFLDYEWKDIGLTIYVCLGW